MTQAFIGLGSNLAGPEHQIRRGLRCLSNAEGITLGRESSLYRSKPIGQPGQPDYCNAVAEVDTTLSAQTLLDMLLAIEAEAGRTRGGERWGPRILDLDLLVYGQHQIDEANLKVPHPEISRRNFVLVPLESIAANLSVPGLGVVAELVEKAPQDGLALW